MKKNRILCAVLLVVSLAFALSVIAQQSTADTAKDPVCGMMINKADAKVTYDYKGTTYYFCGEGCKAKFVQNPEKYLQPKDEAKGVYTCPMHPEVKADQPGKCPKCGMALEKKGMPRGQMMMGHQGMSCPRKGMMSGEGQAGGTMCPLHSQDVEIKAKNKADGVVVTITSKNAETVKKIQAHFAEGKACCPKCAGQKTEKQ